MTEMPMPPMSGENIPIKELKPVKKAGVAFHPQSKTKSKIYVLFIILLLLFFAGGIIFGLFIQPKQKQKQLTSPSPSPLVSPSPSPSPLLEAKGLEAKVLQFEKKLEKVDLEEEELTPPVLDFNIRFKID